MRSRILRSRVLERVVVTLKTGESFAGVLFAIDSRALVLRQATATGAGQRREDLPLDGELIALLPDVAYIQRP